MREGRALHYNLYSSRTIVGEQLECAETFLGLSAQGAITESIDILFTDSAEVEAVKLFFNAYLAMHIAYFNELDSCVEPHTLDSKQITEGVNLDPCTGSYYNNPRFGCGGYCLAKDSKQLLVNFKSMVPAIVGDHTTRKNFIADPIIRKNLKLQWCIAL